MKKSVLLAVSAGLVAAALTATPAAAADPAPKNVKISWKDNTVQFVHVSWDDDGGLPNKVVTRREAGSAELGVVYVPAGGPDAVDIPAGTFSADSELEIAVSVGTEGGETSPATASPRFDTYRARPSDERKFTLAGDATVLVEWKYYEVTDTGTPNDPLDRPGSTLYTPQYRLHEGDKPVSLGEPSVGTFIGFGAPVPRSLFSVAARNEWGGYAGVDLTIGYAGLKAVIPAWAQVNSPQAKITGTFEPAQAQVVLQARNSASSPWYVVASKLFQNRQFEFDLGASGSRQYRVALPTIRDDAKSEGWFGGYSQVVATTMQQAGRASWVQPVVQRGATAKAPLIITPGLTSKAVLQRWTGTTWATVGSVSVANGRGEGVIRVTTPGRVAYRYYLPAASLNGLPYAAAYTPNFVLTTV
ncbi:hypothetical protein BWI15_36065 [Kribbella sp. ALI-6-A]|uniref:hypothetical protein n=1 Tax=Kribbella sp. ALI-6-A TaxID=1933817 RepID=UPI00097BDEC7|nr:hypothetical protein [Kribbella sp. ALI-6-A]ONI68411.1 hypothetical protein BWI15_36065 [Kribbella sp. ALI-6-A]